MTTLKTVILLVATFCALVTALQAAAVNAKEDHEKFFKKLSETEKEMLMALAIAHFDVPDPTENEPKKGETIFPITPLIKPRPEEIPANLFRAMMNGEVSSKWMKEFLKWLEKDMNISKASLDKFRKNVDTNELCDTSSGNCYSLNDLGAQCCPFG